MRSFLFAKDNIFHCDLSKEKQKSSVPLPLLNLVLLISDGESGFDDLSANAESTTVNLAQLLLFNAAETKWRSDGFVRYSKTNKPPLFHLKLRKEFLIGKLANEGLSISYKRVEEIESLIT